MSNIVITDAKPRRESWLPEEAKLLRRWSKLLGEHKLAFELTCLSCHQHIEAYDRQNEYWFECECRRRVIPK